MTCCRNYFLCFDNFSTNGTMATFSKSCFCTSRSFVFISYNSMTFSRNYFLCFDGFATNRTMATFGKSCFSAGGRFSFVYYFCMTFSRNYFLCFDDFSTNGTMATFGKSCFSAGWSFILIVHNSMTCRIDNFSFCCITDFAGISFYSVLGTGGFFCNFAVIPNVCSKVGLITANMT